MFFYDFLKCFLCFMKQYVFLMIFLIFLCFFNDFFVFYEKTCFFMRNIYDCIYDFEKMVFVFYEI